MNTLTLTMAAMVLAAVLFEAAACGFFWSRGERIGATERLLRRRNLGATLFFLALAWCIPQIEAVAWNWLTPWLWPLAVVGTAASWYCLENLLPRAVGGMMILAAYHFLQVGFAGHFPWALTGAILSWGLGILGILISAKPCWLRDYCRWSAKNAAVRWTTVLYCEVNAVYLVVVAIMLGGRL